jgi:cytochrome c biogenesis protein CcmG, thiol:disulfide interchange protein DsbE
MLSRFLSYPIFLIIIMALTNPVLAEEKQAPDFKAKTLDGEKIELAKFLKNGPVLISFWATSCKPCIEELNNLRENYDEFKKKGFELLAVSQDGPRSIPKVRNLVSSLRWKYVVILDMDMSISKKYQVLGIPHTVLINKDGKIIYTHTTYRKGDDKIIKDKISELLKDEK